MQEYKISILAPALTEISQIAEKHLFLVGAKSAKTITDKLFNSIERLKNFPLSCPVIDDEYLKPYGYRMLVIDSYICIYRVIDTVVTVYHIVDGRTNYPSLFR